MNITVTKNQVSINTDYILNDKEYNVNKCYFTFSDEYTDDLVKKAIFVQGTSTIEMSIINNQCQIPAEVLNNGQFELRVYAYEVDGEELLLRYSPSYTTAYVRTGSYIENAESPEVITPTQFEQYMQAMNDGLNEVANVDIDAEQLDNGMSVTITNRYGENKTVYAHDGEKGETGATGATGNGIASITKTSTSGLTDTYTITFTNGNTTIFTVSNGKGIVSVEKTGTNLLADTYTITYNDNTTSSFVIMNGKGIANIELTSTSDLVDTYTITYNDNTTTTYNVTNGNGILSIEKTGTVDNVDTYTIYYTNGTTSTFTVTNSTVTDQEFETLETEVNKYKTLSLLLPKVTGEGSSIELNDTVEGVTIDITPEGNTEQTTYTGKNLLGLIIGRTDTVNGVTITITPDGYVKLHGTANGNINKSYNWAIAGSTYSSKEYTYSSTYSSGTVSSNFVVNIRSGSTQTSTSNQFNPNSLYVNNSLRTETFTASGSGYITGIQFIINNGVSFDNFIIKLQVEESSTATDYEPYVGGTASPNPNYSQDVKVVKGNNTINIIGKNLFDKDNANVLNNIYIDENLQMIKAASNVKSIYMKILGGKTYTVSKIASSRFRVATTKVFPADNVSVYNYKKNDSGTNITITANNDSQYMVIFLYNSTTDTLTFEQILDSIQIEQGSTATDYEPYQTPQEYPIYLEDLELCKIGDYQDYIYKENDNWYKYGAIGKVVLNGSEDNNSFYIFSGVSSGNSIYISTNLIDNLVKNETALSNYFIYKNVYAVDSDEGFYISNSTPKLRFRINKTKASTISEFKTWLSTHNTTVYYVLETPTLTEITDTTLINQLNNLYSAVANQDKTFIECTSTDLNNVPLIVKASTYKDISSILNPVMEREE